MLMDEDGSGEWCKVDLGGCCQAGGHALCLQAAAAAADVNLMELPAGGPGHSAVLLWGLT